MSQDTPGQEFTKIREIFSDVATQDVLSSAGDSLEEQIPSIEEDSVHRALRSFDDRIVDQNLIGLCRKDFTHENYADASRRATQYLSQRVYEQCKDELSARESEKAKQKGSKPGVLKDGTALMQQVFALDNPVLMVPETLKTQNDQSQQLGYGNLMQGVIGAFRNPRSHDVFYQDDPLQAILIIELVQHLLEVLSSSHLISLK